jgi:hypothetical protein
MSYSNGTARATTSQPKQLQEDKMLATLSILVDEGGELYVDGELMASELTFFAVSTVSVECAIQVYCCTRDKRL